MMIEVLKMKDDPMDLFVDGENEYRKATSKQSSFVRFQSILLYIKSRPTMILPAAAFLAAAPAIVDKNNVGDEK